MASIDKQIEHVQRNLLIIDADKIGFEKAGYDKKYPGMYEGILEDLDLEESILESLYRLKDLIK